ncbi:MAG: hypothetical protein RIT27_2226 [Pseudomonadota bacterium]|jgi:hypothetical protein
MNTTQLSLQQTPSLHIPLRFFLTAPLFAILAMVLLFLKGETLFSNRWSMDFLAFTHLFTIGVMLQIMSGALLQLLPVLFGVILTRVTLWSSLIHGSLTLGTFLLAIGWVLDLKIALQISWLFLLLGGFTLISIVTLSLFKSPNQNPILTSVRLAVIALFITIGLGLLLLVLFAWNITIYNPIFLTHLHLNWGLLGWTLLLVVGIAYQVVPMFQITPPYSNSFSRRFSPFLFGILVFYTLGIPLELVLVLLVISFAIITLHIQHKRLRKLPDMTLNFWRVAMIGLIISALFYLTGFVWAFPQREILQGILFVGGFILPVIQGMLYKIVPFLVWLHLTNLQTDFAQKVKIPNMKQIIIDKWQRWHFWLYFSAYIMTVITVVSPHEYFSFLAAFLGMIAFGLLEYNLLKATQIYLTFRQRILSTVRP